jgi:hypothetical protein
MEGPISAQLYRGEGIAGLLANLCYQACLSGASDKDAQNYGDFEKEFCQ